MTSSAGMPQFYHPGPSEFALAPSVDYPFTGLLSPYSSRPSMSVPLPSTPADIQTNTSPLTPVAENRFIDSSPVFNTPLPFETLMSNLQELLAADHHAKNAKKATEAACTQSSVGPACFSTPTEDVWQKQHDTSFNSSIHSNTPEAVPYSNNQMVPNISVTPYPIGFNMPATQYPTNWIVPNTSAMESTAYPTNQVVPNILSSSSPSSSEAEYPTEQARIAAREHALKVKFSQLAKHQTMSPQVKELSDFLQTQCAQIEMYRLQQLTETSYPHHKEWLNGQCDSQLHQLMDRVEVSLQVLEKCATDNGRRHDGSRRKIPESVSRVFEAWYQANVHHPYPTAEMCLQLADTTGMKVQQVRKWFSNKRCRSKVLQRSMGKSLDEGVTIQMH
ncbi:homeobox protein 4-like [Gigantopelta aegis]|uniref:homeobox protein 4-like n=1 Tax=Gigantopelta aegis TaxID=1735272 RepID=UPI001B88CEC5|nr:homeobox protein 4-like [Gigantopelta aegis]